MDELVGQLVGLLVWALLYLLGALLRRRRARGLPPAMSGPSAEPPRPSGGGRPGLFEGLARAERAGRLRREAALARAAAEELARAVADDPRMERIRPVVVDELLPRLARLEVTLAEARGGLELLDAEAELGARRRLLGYLQMMVAQRRTLDLRFLGDADAVAEACFRPVTDFMVAEGLPLATAVPVTVHGRWDLAIDLAFRDSRVAPVRLPSDFGESIWAWPALAHEVAHDVYFSVAGLEDEIHRRLGLSRGGALPDALGSADDCRRLYGAWMAELFADLVGVLMMGPAYAETMLRLFADPARPLETRAAQLLGPQTLGPHPPRRLRLRLACGVLDYLGRHAEAASLRARWEALHDGAASYVLPTILGWVEVPEDRLEVPGAAILEVFLTEGWQSLNGFWLMDIPSFSYLPSEHAQVGTLRRALARGHAVRADPRLVVAAAVLAAVDAPSLHRTLLEATRRSIVGVGTGERRHARAPSVAPAGVTRGTGGRPLADAWRDPEALTEAVALAALLGPRRARPGVGSRS